MLFSPRCAEEALVQRRSILHLISVPLLDFHFLSTFPRYSDFIWPKPIMVVASVV